MNAVSFILLSFCLVAGHVATAANSNSAAAIAMRNVNSLQAALSNITGVTGRPVSYKNIEAARYIAYASGGMMVPTSAYMTVLYSPSSTEATVYSFSVRWMLKRCIH
jgi:hypothetical protein